MNRFHPIFDRRRLVVTKTLAVVLFCAVSCSAGGELDAQERPTGDAARHFEQHIRPLLAAKCLKCHGEQKQEGNLRLDSRQTMLKGGDSGPAITPGAPGESLLMEAIRYESLEMPPTQQLSEKEIRQMELWIAADAVWGDEGREIREASGGITDADRQWWAFRPLVRPPVPVARGDRWSRTPIDRFVYRRLSEQQMQPAPQAEETTLVRRLYFDVLGLPPTPEQIEAFVREESPLAWERLIDKLLADPRYGEHWARYWLDVVRFSESDGWNQDAFRSHIWRYRDYVVRSFNEDKPYPDFVREQLAGDELANQPTGGHPQHLAAAGFLRLGIYEYNQRDARSHWDDIMNEMTDVVGDVFFGMGMACARCHDHKFDPVLQRDYFQLRAFFEPIVWRDDLSYATFAQREQFHQQRAIWKDATQDVRARIDALLSPYHDRKWKSTVAKFPLDIQACFHKPVEQRNSWEDQMAYLVSRQFVEEGGGPLKEMKKQDQQKYEDLQKELAAFDHLKPQPLPPVMTATDFSGAVSPTVVPDDPQKTPIEPGFLTVLSGGSSDGRSNVLHVEKPECDRTANSSGRRTALAKWIGRADNPLTMRVIVNRVWQQHFGQGLVATANDFGRRGQPPTHPQLLDWLTASFVESGWSMKKLHKLILMSAVWRQSAHHPRAVEYQALDPAENLLWRARIRRLNAEQIRDAMLAVSGQLQTQVGGPSVDAKSPRRALYVKSFRNTPDPFLHAFDVANGLKSVSQRDTTVTPTQALLMINGDYSLGQAKNMAMRLQNKESAVTENCDPDTLKFAFRLTWGRDPSPNELENALDFVATGGTRPQSSLDQYKLIDFCHILFNSNEFLYVE